MERRKKNRGFSLIELVIAIAILIILTGLLAPQFMKYIEQSRQAKMIHTLDSIYHGLEVSYVEVLKEGNDRGLDDNLAIGFGEGESDAEIAFAHQLKTIIDETEIKKTIILITFNNRENPGGVGKEDTWDSYYIDGATIWYYPDTDDRTHYYYSIQGSHSETSDKGNYGEVKDGKTKVWR